MDQLPVGTLFVQPESMVYLLLYTLKLGSAGVKKPMKGVPEKYSILFWIKVTSSFDKSPHSFFGSKAETDCVYST